MLGTSYKQNHTCAFVPGLFTEHQVLKVLLCCCTCQNSFPSSGWIIIQCVLELTVLSVHLLHSAFLREDAEVVQGGKSGISASLQTAKTRAISHPSLPRRQWVCALAIQNCFLPPCLCLCCSLCSTCPFPLPLVGLHKTHFIDVRVSESRDLLCFIHLRICSLSDTPRACESFLQKPHASQGASSIASFVLW